MYKLVIVDDEEAIRKGMKNFISWETLGFEVVADFEDGKETIDYINEQSVDVIITDIEMAQIDGLALAKYVFEKELPIKVVVLSGYKLFDYAQKAVEYNVEHYLLKPLHFDEIRSVFEKIKQDLDREKETRIQSKSEKDAFRSIRSELRDQFFIGLLIGHIRTLKDVVKKKVLAWN